MPVGAIAKQFLEAMTIREQSTITIIYTPKELQSVKEHLATYKKKGYYVAEFGDFEDKRFYKLKRTK